MPSTAPDPERFAFEAMRRVLGHDVQLFDDNTAPGMVDGCWSRGDGTRGVVEVRLVIDQREAQLQALMARTDNKFPVEGLRSMWSVRVTAEVKMKDLERDLGDLLQVCEQRGIGNPDRLRWSERLELPLGRYLTTGDLSAWCIPGTPGEGYVWLLPTGGGGMAGGEEHVRDWLGQLLASDDLTKHMAKLERAEADERHLFLGVHTTGAPFSVFYALTSAEVVPESPPDVPDWLDAVWLTPEWAVPLLLWRRDAGWSRHDLYNGNPGQHSRT